jgi:hypothetical protein
VARSIWRVGVGNQPTAEFLGCAYGRVVESRVFQRIEKDVIQKMKSLEFSVVSCVLSTIIT